ncbi:MAG: DUF3795 domain-containing protein [Eubacteriales bacterium]|nr:DUF3795 domain-containing protein [Eubacteriales bacterium]
MISYPRGDQLLSLCGLNCGLCPMRVGRYCPGCGGGEGNQPCAVLRCAATHGNLEYCYQCGEYPCARYAGANAYDSFVTHKNQFTDFIKAQKIGLTAYHAEQTDKVEILARLLSGYNDGRRKSLYCLAVNLLDMNDLRTVMAQVAQMESETESGVMSEKQKATITADKLQAVAAERGVTLKIRSKPKTTP